jgi:hypothetical protein
MGNEAGAAQQSMGSWTASSVQAIWAPLALTLEAENITFRFEKAIVSGSFTLAGGIVTCGIAWPQSCPSNTTNCAL